MSGMMARKWQAPSKKTFMAFKVPHHKKWQGGKKHLIKSDLSFNIKCEESKMF